jgi:hypothetical protein
VRLNPQSERVEEQAMRKHHISLKLLKRPLLFGAVVFSTVAFSAVPAYASSVEGSRGYYGPIDGHSYENWNTLYNEGESGSWGYIKVATQQGSTVPAGWMGGDPRIYKEGGALCLDPGWTYNSESTSSIAFWSGSGIADQCGSGNYYSSGASRAWDGSGYDTYSSFASLYLYI